MVSHIAIWRKYMYPDVANQKSWMFIGNIMNRGDTWSSRPPAAVICQKVPPLSLINGKVHSDNNEPATVFASIKCLKRNRTSRILYWQIKVTFFWITYLETSRTFPYFHTPAHVFLSMCFQIRNCIFLTQLIVLCAYWWDIKKKYFSVYRSI